MAPMPMNWGQLLERRNPTMRSAARPRGGVLELSHIVYKNCHETMGS
jgi:hypothetical protein